MCRANEFIRARTFLLSLGLGDTAMTGMHALQAAPAEFIPQVIGADAEVFTDLNETAPVAMLVVVGCRDEVVW